MDDFNICCVVIGSVAISCVTAVTVAEVLQGHDGTLYAGFVGFVTSAITLILSKLYHDRKYKKKLQEGTK